MKTHLSTFLACCALVALLFLGACKRDEAKVERLTTPIGTTKREIRLPCTYWYEGFLCTSQAALIGKVKSVTDRKDDHEPSMGTWHDYVLELSGIAGDCPELAGVTEVHAETFSEVKAGTWVVVYVHDYEKKPSVCTGAREPIQVEGPDAPFPHVLLRTGLHWERFSDADLEILRHNDPAGAEQIISWRKASKDNAGG